MINPHRLLRVVRRRWRALFHRDSVDRELARELAFHLDQLTQEFVADGMPVPAARLAARRAVGNVPLLEEQCRDARSVSWLHDIRQDIVYGFRVLRRNPAFTSVALLSLAIGIGANTAILSVIDVVMRDRLPIPDDDRIVVLRTYPLDNVQQETHGMVADFFAFRDEARSFDRFGAALGNSADFGADGSGTPAERIQGQSATAGTFAALGVQPLLGRVFTEGDESGSNDTPSRVIIISHRLWQRRFGGRPDIIGLPLRLERINRTVVGVMPEGFRYPSEVTDYWIPLLMDRSQDRNPQRFFVMTARLKPGVTLEQAQSDVDLIAARLARLDPERHEGWGVRVKPVRNAMFGWTRERLFTLEAAVALVLLVACANLAGLLFARGVVRGPEIALRTALGAGRGRIVRQLLTESVLLSCGGGVLGLVVAWIGIRALVAMNPPPGGVAISSVTISIGTLATTAVIAVVTGLIYGVAPALMHARAALTASLKEPAGGSTRRRPHVRGVLVAAQVAVTTVLLVGAALLMNSFVRVISRDVQFDPDRLLSFELRFPLSDYLHRQGTVNGLPYYEISPPPSIALERVYRGLRALPGAESAAGISIPILNSLVVPTVAVDLDGRQRHAAPTANSAPPSLAIGIGTTPSHIAGRQDLTASYFLVTPDFFRSIRSTLVRGRDIGERDTASSQWVAIVNESAAHRFWPGEDPVGRELTIVNSPDERPRTIVGVVRDIPLTLQGDLRPAIYTSFLQQPTHYPVPGANMFGQMVFMVRSIGDPMSLLPLARRVVDEIDPDRPLANVATMQQHIASLVPQRGYFVFAITLFALTATLLAAIGIYGVLAYSVAQRTREIGVRLALGAAAHEVIALVGRHTLITISIGLLVGLVGALGVTRLLQSQLWGVTATDPATFAGVGLLFVLVAIVAVIVPMRRAISIDPTTALRCE